MSIVNGKTAIKLLCVKILLYVIIIIMLTEFHSIPVKNCIILFEQSQVCCVV